MTWWSDGAARRRNRRDYAVLAAVDGLDWASGPAVGRRARLSAAACSTALERLTGEGLLVREAAGDGWWYRVTDAGRDRALELAVAGDGAVTLPHPRWFWVLAVTELSTLALSSFGVAALPGWAATAVTLAVVGGCVYPLRRRLARPRRWVWWTLQVPLVALAVSEVWRWNHPAALAAAAVLGTSALVVNRCVGRLAAAWPVGRAAGGEIPRREAGP